MSELKRYDLYTSSQLYFIDGCPMYKCSDIDPILPVWIPVSDKQPPIGETVLWFYTGEHSERKVSIQTIFAHPVTLNAYWMPLPPAPTA